MPGKILRSRMEPKIAKFNSMILLGILLLVLYPLDLRHAASSHKVEGTIKFPLPGREMLVQIRIPPSRRL